MRSILAILGLWLVLLGAAAGIPAASPLPLSDYIQQLQQLQESLQPQLSAARAGKLADACRSLDRRSRRTKVRRADHRGRLASCGNMPAAPRRGRWKLRAGKPHFCWRTHAPCRRPATIPQDERARLTAILARREFHEVHGETWFDRMKAAATRLLTQVFGRIITSSVFPVVSRIVVWALVGLVAVLLLLWLLRTYRQSHIYTNISGSPSLLAEKPWRDWQAEAQRASEQGQWRDAVHFYYWAAISFLEERELWRPDPARTPREYLRLVASQDERRVPLEQLTLNFERTWYGNDAATEQSARSARTLVESLGCR